MADLIEKEKYPAQFILITPEYKGAQLKELQKQKGLETTLFAHDPKNVKNISLRNIMQCFVSNIHGKTNSVNSRGLTAAVKPLLSQGTHRVSKEGISNEKVLQLWWMLERGRTGAIPLLSKFAKSKGAHQADAQILLAIVQKKYDAVFAAIQSQAVSIDAFDNLEALIVQYTGLKTKPAKKLLKTFFKDKSLKEEFKARSMWFQIQKMAQSNKAKDQEMAKGGRAHLFKKYPDTKYGKMAADK